MSNQERVNELLQKLEVLSKKQDSFRDEINQIREELYRLKDVNIASEENETKFAPLYFDIPYTSSSKEEPRGESIESPKEPVNYFGSEKVNTPRSKSDIEKFIGENLINKIGIVITIIGVAIGAKYAIEHELISPLTRIIIGYLIGAGLLGFAIKLKKDYENFSAVLLSGAMAIMYFITYAAYDFYQLFPQVIAFVLMVVFTCFTVFAAINYNKQVIAHIGLVGAYAVPFLLSEGSGRVVVLFTYMALINAGILVLSYKKYWKPLYYSSFVLTWVIYYLWFNSSYRVEEHLTIAMVFLSVFFLEFYATFLSYKLIRGEKYEKEDVIPLLLNSFLFYGIGYILLSGHETGGQLLGLFTLINAIVHFSVSVLIYRQNLADKNMFYLIAGLVLLFITIAFPVQLEGNWVTLLWAGEAALLFWIGRTKGVGVYEKMSYPVMLVSFLSILQDWMVYVSGYDRDNMETFVTPFLNINFATSVLFVCSFVFINVLLRNERYSSPFVVPTKFSKALKHVIPGILIVSIYFSIRVELERYFEQSYQNSFLDLSGSGEEMEYEYLWNWDIEKFRKVWLLNYTLLFLAALSMVNIKRLKESGLATVNLVLNGVFIFTFIFTGLSEMGDLRNSFLTNERGEYYEISSFHVWIRYVSYLFLAAVVWSNRKYMEQEFAPQQLKIPNELFTHFIILSVLSSELINWLEIGNIQGSDKLGLSILWGVYSLVLIGIGIWKRKKHYRIASIVLFAVTLAKLFFYDISHLSTIAKTVLFVALGVLLLIISFMYNKYKHLISDEV